MKIRLLAIFAVVFATLLIFYSLKNQARHPVNGKMTEHASVVHASHYQTNELRRISVLETAGQVPEGDQNYNDWRLAQQCTWWGKPLDSKEFWKGRVLWNDAKATLDAQRHGRLYPPMPYEDTNLPPRPNDDGIHGSYLPDSPNILYASSSKETAFWDRFDKTHPRPPDQIDQEQYSASQSYLAGSQDDFIRELEIGQKYPPEAFTKEALFWAYVQGKRKEFQEGISRARGPGIQIYMTNFISNLLVESKYVTEPLSQDQVQSANSWKVAYLKRLNEQNTDQPYINAYMQAWNLSSNDIFGSGN